MRLSKVFRYPCAILFGLLLAALTIADLLIPDAEMSEIENRALKQPPALRAEALIENRWTAEYGEYVREQFVMRGTWLKMHSLFEQSLQKVELGGVWLAGEGYLMSKTAADAASLQPLVQTNARAVCALGERYPGRVYAMLVPSASNVLEDLLRCDPPRFDENAAIDAVYGMFKESGINVIDLRESFREAAGSGLQVYYRTDHHWTTDVGAQLAYIAYCEAAGLAASPPPEHLKQVVGGFLGTDYAKALNAFVRADELVYYDYPYTISIERRAPDGTAFMQEDSLMAYEKLESIDKYGAFLHGINGYTHIEGGGGSGAIAIIKDSYGNCFAPFLAANYASVEAIDLRGRQKIDDILDTGCDILVLYSFSLFSQDTDLFWLRGAGFEP
ncbi:MAG: DHHW family protein [Oscillospiraceae bacterium]|nr:DHHW family protein [Oscillospiraceae bacterium]